MFEREWPLPSHYDPEKVGQVYRVPYQSLAQAAHAWRKEQKITPAAEDSFRIALFCVDVQNTFCLPDFELFVGGKSGTGAVDDNRRLCEFIYRNLGYLTEIHLTMDTHYPLQIFHPLFLVNAHGEHPEPYTLVTVEDVESGKWRFNAHVAKSLGIRHEDGQKHLLHYVRRLKEGGKYELTIWPYHAMLGGVGHAIVAAVEEAVFFHSVCRYSQPVYHVKGNHPLTEFYSVFGPEVREDAGGRPLVPKNEALFRHLMEFDAVLIAGQAKSHCVAWSVSDLLTWIQKEDPSLAGKVYLLEDCTSPVVVPGMLDYSKEADAAFQRFAEAGMHRVKSTEPIRNWLRAA